MTNEVRKDYCVLIGGGIAPRWLAHESLEDDGEPSHYPPTTEDPEMAFRTASHKEAQATLRACVKRYPSNQFRVSVLEPLGVTKSEHPPSQSIAVSTGLHLGRVVAVEAGKVIQDTGRGKLVSHDLAGFDQEPNLGDQLEVAYRNGVMSVKNRDSDLQRSGVSR